MARMAEASIHSPSSPEIAAAPISSRMMKLLNWASSSCRNVGRGAEAIWLGP